MSTPLDEHYFEWLYRQVCSAKVKNPNRTYRNLLWMLYTEEFLWFVPNDDNRVEDGKVLRHEYLQKHDLTPDDVGLDWFELNCSFLEVLIGLARRLDFLMNGGQDEWFWEMLDNLDLHKYNDTVHIPQQEVKRVVDRVVWRTYRYNGHGGLFPLQQAREDQRDTELWYQLNAYILERS